MPIRTFAELLGTAKEKGPKTVAVAAADESEVLYKVDNAYNPEAEGGILWNDPQLHIPWPARNPIVSRKDARFGTLEEFVRQWGGIDLKGTSPRKKETCIEHSVV